MLLTYKVHLDDFHSKVEAHGIQSEAHARLVIEDERRNGYDVGEIRLDGKVWKP